jgi:hypothetical protein
VRELALGCASARNNDSTIRALLRNRLARQSRSLYNALLIHPA